MMKTHWDWNTVFVLMVTDPVEIDLKPYLLRRVPYSIDIQPTCRTSSDVIAQLVITFYKAELTQIQD